MNRIGRQRLHPSDLYHMLDWLRDEWGQDWERTFKQHARLEWHLLELPSRFHAPALEQLEVLKRAQLVDGIDWQGAIRRLERIVSEWARSRKAAA